MLKYPSLVICISHYLNGIFMYINSCKYYFLGDDEDDYDDYTDDKNAEIKDEEQNEHIDKIDQSNY